MSDLLPCPFCGSVPIRKPTCVSIAMVQSIACSCQIFHEQWADWWQAWCERIAKADAIIERVAPCVAVVSRMLEACPEIRVTLAEVEKAILELSSGPRS